MNLSGALAGGFAGALISSLVWIAIGYITGYELGILAVGVGIACGIGAAIGAKGRAGTSGALIAAACALVAIVAARYVLVQITINQVISEATAENGSEVPGPENGEFWTGFIADRLVREAERSGETLDPPDDNLYDESDLATHYPAAIWAQAQAKWNSLGPSDRREFCAAGIESVLRNRAQGAEDFRGVASVIGVLVSNFHPMALILMAIAVGGAFKVARNSTPTAEGHAEEFAMASTSEPSGMPQQPSAPSGLPNMPPASPSAGLPGMPPPSAGPQREFKAPNTNW